MSENTEAVIGSLEQRGVTVETTIDDSILTPSGAKAVKFKQASPVGYAFGQVETFIIDIVIPSLTWYQHKLHERDKVVYFLGDELDKMETDVKNLKAQVAFAEQNNNIAQTVNLREEDKEFAALADKLDKKTAEVEELKLQLASLNSGGTVIGATSEAEYIAAIGERDTYIEQVLAQLTEINTRYEEAILALQTQTSPGGESELEAQIVALLNQVSQQQENLIPSNEGTALVDFQEQNTQLYTHIEAITAQYNELMSRYETDIANLQAQLTSVDGGGSGGISEARETELLAHIEAITAQYNELMSRYETDITNLQTQLTSGGSEGISEARETELLAHIEAITAQNNDLATQMHSIDNSEEVGKLRVELESERAKTLRLEERLLELLSTENVEEEEEPTVKLPEQLKSRPPRGIDLNNLPSGIRADDL